MAKIPSAQMHLKLEDLASNKGLSKESEEISGIYRFVVPFVLHRFLEGAKDGNE